MSKMVSLMVKAVDNKISGLYLDIFGERSSLLIALFHNIFREDREIELNLKHPNQRTTVKDLRRFVDYYLESGYKFICPDDILNGLKTDKKYCMITFDDGYYSNINALAILKEYNIPAVFFIATNFIKENKCFWWDVLYRERIKQKASFANILSEEAAMKSKRNDEIEGYLRHEFGEKAFKPIGDIDRPFTPSEIKKLSEEELVFFGNHTSDHAILPNYSEEGIRSQIVDAQGYLRGITGKPVNIISYPNGNYSRRVIDISRTEGIGLGITVEPRKNYLPINPDSEKSMRLGRFVINGANDLTSQFNMFRSDIAICNSINCVFKSSGYE